MVAIQLYFLSFTFFRSISNGIDHIYGTSTSLALSVTALAAGPASAWLMRGMRIHRSVYTLLICLWVYIAICVVSFILSDQDGAVIDPFAALYAIFRYVYMSMFIVLIASLYQYPNFCRNVHRIYLLLLFVIAGVGLAQYATGHAEFATVYDKYARVAGLSSHPVPYSLEIVLTFCVCELSRQKARLPIRLYHIVVYTLFFVALVLSASRTGVALLAITGGVFLLARKPSLLPPCAAAFAIALWLTPFGELFADLRTVPDYITSGEYVTWDWRTATTSVHWRIHHWYYLTTLGLERSWIGYGPGQEILYSPFNLEAHNQFVEIFFETGFIGLISFATFWFSMRLVANSSRRHFMATYGKKSVEIGALQFWNAMFVGVTLVAMADQSFNMETVSFSHLLISMFVVLADPKAVTQQNLFRATRAPVPMNAGSRAIGALSHLDVMAGLGGAGLRGAGHRPK